MTHAPTHANGLPTTDELGPHVTLGPPVDGSRGRLDVRSGYGDEDAPLATYAAIATVFTFIMFLTVRTAERREVRRRRTPLSRFVRPRDVAPDPSALEVVLGGLASFRFARLVARDKVTAFLRAPFVEYHGPGRAPGELNESARGSGLRHTCGVLLTCPYCLTVWVTGMLGGLSLLAPRYGRFVTRLFASVAVADAVHEGYVLLDAQRREVMSDS